MFSTQIERVFVEMIGRIDHQEGIRVRAFHVNGVFGRIHIIAEVIRGRCPGFYGGIVIVFEDDLSPAAFIGMQRKVDRVAGMMKTVDGPDAVERCMFADAVFFFHAQGVIHGIGNRKKAQQYADDACDPLHDLLPEQMGPGPFFRRFVEEQNVGEARGIVYQQVKRHGQVGAGEELYTYVKGKVYEDDIAHDSHHNDGPQGRCTAEEEEDGCGDLAAADEELIGEGVAEEGPGDTHRAHVHYPGVEGGDIGIELYVQHFGSAVLHDGISEEYAEHRLQQVLEPDIMMTLFVDDAPDDGQQECGTSGDGEEAEVPGKVAAAVGISEENVYHHCGKEQEKGLESEVF